MPPINTTGLSKKIVAVVGGGTGIGAAIARELAMAGAKVTVGGRRSEPLKSLAAKTDSPEPIRVHTVDVADQGSVTEFFRDLTENVGSVEILVNCAGINIAKRTMSEMEPDEWERVLRINATGAYRCMHAALPAMRDRRDGLIINVSSVAGKRAIALGGVVYCASKFAMTALGTAVGNEVRHEGVRVTNVYPGEVNTPILDKRPVPVSQEHKDSILQPEDIASVVRTICELPPRACVPEIVIKPTTQEWV